MRCTLHANLFSRLHCSPVLAFSLGDTKQVVLCDAEKAEILHVFPVELPVSCMHWMEVMEENRYVCASLPPQKFLMNKFDRHGAGFYVPIHFARIQAWPDLVICLIQMIPDVFKNNILDLKMFFL